MASHPNRWRTAGVFLDDATIGDRADASRQTANNGVEEIVIAAPLPGCSRRGLEDGTAEPIILYRLLLDSSGPLN